MAASPPPPASSPVLSISEQIRNELSGRVEDLIKHALRVEEEEEAEEEDMRVPLPLPLPPGSAARREAAAQLTAARLRKWGKMPRSLIISGLGNVQIIFEDGSCLLQSFPETQYWSYMLGDCYITGSWETFHEDELDAKMTLEVILFYATDGQKKKRSVRAFTQEEKDMIARLISDVSQILEYLAQPDVAARTHFVSQTITGDNAPYTRAALGSSFLADLLCASVGTKLIAPASLASAVARELRDDNISRAMVQYMSDLLSISLVGPLLTDVVVLPLTAAPKSSSALQSGRLSILCCKINQPGHGRKVLQPKNIAATFSGWVRFVRDHRFDRFKFYLVAAPGRMKDRFGLGKCPGLAKHFKKVGLKYNPDDHGEELQLDFFHSTTTTFVLYSLSLGNDHATVLKDFISHLRSLGATEIEPLTVPM